MSAVQRLLAAVDNAAEHYNRMRQLFRIAKEKIGNIAHNKRDAY
jgi:hypothetical protein